VSKSPRLLYPAEQEMYHAARYYELQACRLGQDFLDKVVLAIQELLQAPERWPLVQDDIRRRLIGRFPYSLFYRIDPEEIVILAVMHQKRHPSYWLPRKQMK
jgi:plasmid stabilization system protein ParE